LAKVEDTANGAVACQLLDIMYPGQVPMHKVNLAAKQDFEFVANYKILQGCFSKLNIERHIDVDRLISGRYMDNLEFMQWFKRFFEMSVSDKKDYDSIGQRSKGKGGAQYGGGGRRINLKPSSAPSAVPKPSQVAKPVVPAIAKAASKAPEPVASHVHKEKPVTASSVTAHKTGSTTSSDPTATTVEINNLRMACEDSNRAYADLKVEMEGLEKERDFYFEKLRDVEVLLQELEDKGQGNELTASILKILYATADGFEQVVDDGSGVGVEEPESNGTDGHDDTY